MMHFNAHDGADPELLIGIVFVYLRFDCSKEARDWELLSPISGIQNV
jgi:hypothetical protein